MIKFFLIVFLLLFDFKHSYCNIVLPKCAAWHRYGTTITGNFNGTPGISEKELSTPYGLSYDKNGWLFIADSENHRIIQLPEPNKPNKLGNGFGTDKFQLDKPTSVSYENSTNLYYVADSKNARIQRWDFTKSQQTTVAGKLGQFYNTNETFGGGLLGIHMDENGGLYVSDSLNHRVMYFAENQTEGIQIAGTNQSGSGSNELNEPKFFYLDSNRTLFIADSKNQRIQKWEHNAMTGMTVADSSPPLSLKHPASLTMDSDGNMYIVDTELSQVLKWNPSSNETSCVIGCSGINGSRADQLNEPMFILFDFDGDLVVSDTGNNRVQLYSFFTDQNCLHETRNCRPPKVTISPDHPLYVSTPNIEIEQDKPIEFSVSTQIDCDFITYINRNWSISFCKEPLGQECSADSEQNNFMSELPSQNTSDIYIKPFSLKPGYYRIECNVTLFPYGLYGVVRSFLRIIPARPKIYLLENRVIQIVIHQNQTLKLEPVQYSLNTERTFTRSEVNVSYYCRLSPTFAYLSDDMEGLVKMGDEQQINPIYPRCLNSNDFYYNNTLQEYSLTIYPSTLRVGEIYEFQLITSTQMSGRLLVNVIDSSWSFSIQIKCKLNICPIIDEYHQINSDTDTILHSFCLNTCSIEEFSIQWKIFGGKKFFSNESIDWSLFEYEEQGNGAMYQNFTIRKQWFRRYPYLDFFLIKVSYQSSNERGFGISYLKIGHAFFDEICSISSLNGSTKTLFHVECFAPMDRDEKRAYTLFISPSNVSLGTFLSSEFDAYLPIGNPSLDFQLELFVEIRDEYQTSQQFFLPLITVTPDLEETMKLIANASFSLQGNRTEISQYLISFASTLNYLSRIDLQRLLVDSSIDLSAFLVSSLDETRYVASSENESFSFDEYRSRINHRAVIREKLLSFYLHYHPETIHSLLLVSSTLSQLTSNPNELLNSTLFAVSQKSSQMSRVLHSIASNVTREQIEKVVGQLTQCVINTLTGINGVLLQRSAPLQEDIDQLNQRKDEDYSDLYPEEEKDIYFLKQSADVIEKESMQTMNVLNEIFDIHSNRNEQIDMENSKISYRFSKQLQNQTNSFSRRSFRTSLPSYGLNDQYLKHSNSFSISIYDQNRTELKLFDEKNYLTEFLLPRDLNIKQMVFREENLLERNASMNFNHHQIPLIATQENFTYSFHFELQSLNSYLLIYKLNSFPKKNVTDGHIYFCSEDVHEYHHLFLNNLSTRNDKSVLIGIRELDFNETCQSNRSTIRTDFQPIQFSSNYHYRYYSSACFYRDDNKQWRTDGLIVGSKTNLTHTHCYSHRL